MPDIVRCPSCDGYGWYKDDFSGENTDCAWCGGVGYVYQQPDGVQGRIPPADYDTVAETLEALEKERMRELGYTGDAKPPWKQNIRQGTRGGIHPEDRNGTPPD